MIKTKKQKNKTEKKKTELLEKYQTMIHFIQNIVENIDIEMKRVKMTLDKLQNFDPDDTSSLDFDTDKDEDINIEGLDTYTEWEIEVMEWFFDWYFMIGREQKKYPVPLNYSSKTKLVPWDKLKLKIMQDGKFIYKLIHPVDRKHIRAILSKTNDQKFIAVTDDGKTYFLNQAAVTFFKWTSWDELYIVINANEEKNYSAIEAIIKKK